ncbi:hypothetical protein LUZ63_016840 [Rhynchospora breviuscula]|uniref:Dirigent protein n=1 Tax=Rhynchospora breviuscula TaxID=2022672 RepID=A0A9P9ZAL4_9POAL|nr:hypothetical protein LUZ63_016840 [Rhynchospora breviuscula]
MRLYMNQIHKTTEKDLILPNSAQFGQFGVCDWPCYDDLGTNKKLILQVLADRTSRRPRCRYTGPILFKGSTFELRGEHAGKDCEWTIVGGTGQFSEAKGRIYKKFLQNTKEMKIYELNIEATYTP